MDNISTLRDRIPYTYLIGWKKHNLWYYGLRTAKNCNPIDLWKTYFTSSKYVKEKIAELGEPDVIQVRRTFKTVEAAFKFESGVIRRMLLKHRECWLNCSYWAPAGLHMTADVRKRMSLAKMGTTPWNKGLTKYDHPSIMQTSIKATGPNGRTISAEHKEAIGAAWRNKKRGERSIEHKKKITESKRKNGTLSVKWGPNSKVVKGRVGVYHPEQNRKTRIDVIDMQSYLDLGWVKGWPTHTNQYTK